MNPAAPASGTVAPQPAYLRQPTICGDTIAFVADDDLWRISTEGGVATRLSAGLGEAATPALSPCGRWLAYASRDEQHSEVAVMSAAGGPARRLTFLGSDLAVRGFTPEGRILFVCNHGQPFFRHWHAWTVAVEGGAPERVPLGAIDHLAHGPVQPNGQRALVIGRNTGDPARWKRYRGGRTGALWIDADGSRRFRRMSELAGNVSSPMWIGERVWFIGDGEGIGHLHSVRPDGSDLQRHTSHHGHYARHASSDGQRIVYQLAAELWLFDPATDSTRRIDITVPSARTQAARRFVSAADHLQGAALHPHGHSLAAEVRGQSFTMPLWDGAVLRHGGSAARQRLPQWLADGQTLVALSDAGGEERLVQLAGPALDTAAWQGWDIGRAHALVAAPRGRRLALANHRNELLLLDLDGAQLTRIDASPCGRIEGPVFSPCGGWLAYGFAASPRHMAIKLADLDTGRTLYATQPEFRDYAPAFDPEGRYLYFLSLRTYDPVYDSVQFELSFPRAARPYLVALQAGGRPPFDPAPKGMKPERDKDGDEDRAHDGDKPLPAIEPEGIALRVAAFPVKEGRFGQIAGLTKGRVLWTQLPLPGAHGRGGHKESAPGWLERFDFARAQAETLVAECDSFVLAADAHTLLLRTGQRLRVIDAAGEPDDHGGGAPDSRPGRDSGGIDLARIRCAVEPPQEWAQMLAEVWRLQRDHFWVADMSGIDWPAVLARYRPLLAQVATRAELSDLIWELQGELGTSHAYEMGGDHRKPPAMALGQLAAELRPCDDAVGGWEIVRTVRGDAWDATADSPLNAIGVGARAGERIVAIGGQPVGAHEPPAALLVHQAGCRAQITLASADGNQRRDVTVKLLDSETPARYREWVEANRAHVHATSGGQVGYLHLPDMMSAGFAEFHRYFATECDRPGLVIDLRFNRGGHVSQLLLEKVARRRIAWCQMRWGRPEPYPNESPAGAVVALTNEHAGSDGDIFSHGFKLMGLGPLIGTRTWGGVIGIWPRHKLADGTEVTQPEYAFWFKDVGWQVENFGTEPTIVVDNPPEADAFNAPARDVQLARAVQEAVAAASKLGPVVPDFGPRPRLG